MSLLRLLLICFVLWDIYAIWSDLMYHFFLHINGWRLSISINDMLCYMLCYVLYSIRREAPSSMSVPNLKQIPQFVQKLLGVPNFTPPADPFLGVRDGQNGSSWRYSLPFPTNPVWWGSMHAISSYRDNNIQTGPIIIHCAALCNNYEKTD